MSTLWFKVCCFRIISSLFGSVLSRKSDTLPNNLVLQVIQPKQFSTPATRYGIENEKVALEQYVSHQRKNGHPDLFVSECGFLINTNYSVLGASPHGAVYDPSDIHKPFRFLEIKRPYSFRTQTPEEACSSAGVFCEKN